MIDIHCHILPNVDDGASDLEETLEMCHIAVNDGIKAIVATPHQQNGVYNTSSATIIKKVRSVVAAIKNAKLPLRLFPGADVHIDVHTGEKIQQGEILTINNTKRYFLLEFPSHTIPPNIHTLLFNLLLQNITPILTHPERIAEVQEDPNRIYDMLASGVLSQITAMSITGGFGSKAQKCAHTLLEHNLAHIIATDAHSPRNRPPILSEAVGVAKSLVDEKYANAMVTTIPLNIIRGERLESLPPPMRIERKRFWFF